MFFSSLTNTQAQTLFYNARGGNRFDWDELIQKDGQYQFDGIRLIISSKRGFKSVNAIETVRGKIVRNNYFWDETTRRVVCSELED
jgi:hypothetical protein